MVTVSVIIPVYNGERFINEAIESVIKQTYSDWELFIIDDGSTDNTRNICNTYRNYPNFYYFHQDQQGPAKARNVGAHRASGKYFAFLDADDFWYKTKLEVQASCLDSTRSSFCYTNVDEIDQAGRLLNKGYLPDLRHWLENFIKPVPMIPTILVKRGSFYTCGGFNEQMTWGNEDTEFFLRLMQTGGGYYIQEPLAAIRAKPKIQKEHNYGKLNSMFKNFLIQYKTLEKYYGKTRTEFLRYFLNNGYSTHGKDLCRIGKKQEGLQMIWQAIRMNPLRLKNYRRFLTCLLPTRAVRLFLSGH